MAHSATPARGRWRRRKGAFTTETRKTRRLHGCPPTGLRGDGAYSAFLRNPERNQGWFIPVSRLEVRSDRVTLLGRRGSGTEAALAEGRYDEGVPEFILPAIR